jgi:urea transporter/murein DD-endopeptidase MepM/ murein hydrolase activator NlpD
LISDRKSYASFFEGTLNSYSLVFFSTSRIFAWILLAVTFFDFISGLAGLVSILISNLVAWLGGLNLDKIRKGFYGFNALLVGLGLGLFFQATSQFFLIVVFSALFTLFLTVTLEGIIGKYYLPYLSIPFILGIWLTLMATREFNYLQISHRGVYAMNEMYMLGGMTMVRIYDWFNNTGLPQSLIVYFRSLGAILFQYHLFPGLIIAIGLLIYSRIGFLLSLLGFYSAWIFYTLVGADMTTLSYSYIGFNFILTAIAIGGFFIIPSWYSFMWVILLTPITSILLTAFKIFFFPFQLSIYSLPFNIIVITFLYVLKFRERHTDKPELVFFQLYSPEKNLYSQLNNKARFGKHPWFKVGLPFWGDWVVTQGHDGEHTHKEQWKHAWDFEIVDQEGRNHKSSGLQAADYFCYNKPVIAPADGWIEDIIDNIDDNPVGEVNLEHNWGNTVVIRHSDKLFSALSHLKKESVKVHKGAFVKKGELIALVGNSGRSPVPHLHFQFQQSPQVGSETIDLPLSYYILKKKEGHFLRSFGNPALNDMVCNIEANDLLKEAYNLIPGHEIIFRKSGQQEEDNSSVHWSVQVDIYNNTYLSCRETGAKAFFRNEGDMIWFTHFEGSRDSLLYHFFLANYKVIFGFYKNLILEDQFPLHLIGGRLKFLQDLVAPFHLFTRSVFTLKYVSSGGPASGPEMLLTSEARVKGPFNTGLQYNYELYFNRDCLDTFIINSNQKASGKWDRVRDI